jgi:hypothetical protein
MREGCRSALLIIAVCLAAAPAAAQTAPIITLDDFQSIAEIGGGVSIQGPADVNLRPRCEALGLPCSSGKTMPDGGLSLMATGYLSEIVGITGELSTYANLWLTRAPCPAYSVPSAQGCPIDVNNHVRAALAGIRIRSRLISDAGGTHWRLFGELLGGPQWSDVGPRHRVLQPGVGADDYLKNGLVVHVEYAYRFSPDDGRDLSTGRFLVGLVVPVGSR